MVETRTVFPNMWRVANLTHILFLGSHWFAAFYFLISSAEGFCSQWGYPRPVGNYAGVRSNFSSNPNPNSNRRPVGNYSSGLQKYLRSLYWSTLTLTTIGDLQPPETNWE